MDTFEDQKLVNCVTCDDHRIEVSTVVKPLRTETNVRVWLINVSGYTTFKIIGNVRRQHGSDNPDARGFHKLGRDERSLYDDKLFKYYLEVASSEKCIQLNVIKKEDRLEYLSVSIPNAAGDVDITVTKDRHKISEHVVRKMKDGNGKDFWVVRKL